MRLSLGHDNTPADIAAAATLLATAHRGAITGDVSQLVAPGAGACNILTIDTHGQEHNP